MKAARRVVSEEDRAVRTHECVDRPRACADRRQFWPADARLARAVAAIAGLRATAAHVTRLARAATVDVRLQPHAEDAVATVRRSGVRRAGIGSSIGRSGIGTPAVRAGVICTGVGSSTVASPVRDTDALPVAALCTRPAVLVAAAAVGPKRVAVQKAPRRRRDCNQEERGVGEPTRDLGKVTIHARKDTRTGGAAQHVYSTEIERTRRKPML